MIKKIGQDTGILRRVERTVSGKTVLGIYPRTDFIADELTDIANMNASESRYLNYPAGSIVYCVENGKRYILKADCTEYVEVG